MGFIQDTNNIIDLNNDTLNLSDLLPNTDYEFYVSSYCTEDGDTSIWSYLYFTTLCQDFIAPTQIQTFDVVAPECWQEAKGLISDSTQLTFSNSLWMDYNYGNVLSEGTSAYINVYSSNRMEWLISPSIDLGSSQNYQLEFDMITTAYGNPGSPYVGVDDTIRVLISH